MIYILYSNVQVVRCIWWTHKKCITFNLRKITLQIYEADLSFIYVVFNSDLDVMGNVYNEVDDVDMRFKEAADVMSPDISEIYIGDMFFMYIKYMGG
jgi:hypothetical protein